ncbi:hypothetical protein ADK76_34440 [Streptomyces griseoflavus]|nr:hypothetical protein ADK76_34440 [Streptomyces griseoflavus]
MIGRCRAAGPARVRRSSLGSPVATADPVCGPPRPRMSALPVCSGTMTGQGLDRWSGPWTEASPP